MISFYNQKESNNTFFFLSCLESQWELMENTGESQKEQIPGRAELQNIRRSIEVVCLSPDFTGKDAEC